MRQQFLRLAGLLTAAAGEIAFEKVVLSSTNDYAHTVRAADLDGDGDLDAVFAAKHAQVVGWVNNADGIFEQFYEVQIDRRGGLSSVACGDVDGDGTIDVVAAAQAGNALYVYFNNGGGGFTISTISDAAKAPSALELTDVDGDGDLDVVVASFGGELDWYENSGNKFASTPSHAIATGLQLTKAVGVGDVDGDGKIDVVAYDPAHEGPSWWKNPGATGAWTDYVVLKESPVGYSPPEDSWYPSTVKLFDFDGDGDLDIEFVVWRSGAVVVYKNGGAPEEHPWPEVVVARNTDTRMAYASAGDIDGDGYLDVVGALEEGGTHTILGNWVEWYANTDGQITAWSAGQLMGEVDAPNALEVVDVDGDSDIDVLSTSGHDDTVALWRNTLQTATRKPTPGPDLGSDSSKDDDADDAATTGIVVGCVLGAGALGVAAFAWYRYSGAAGSPSLEMQPQETKKPTHAPEPAMTKKQAPPKPPRRNIGNDAV